MSESKSKTKPKRVFTEEFKREAVRLAEERGNVCAAARDLGVHETVLRRWKQSIETETLSVTKEDKSFPAFPSKGNPRDEELIGLQRENARLREDNDILKKAVGIFTKGAR